MSEPTDKQQATLDQLSYLGWHKDLDTVLKWVNY